MGDHAVAQAKNFCQVVRAAVLAVLMLTACHDKGTLEGSRVEYVRVDGATLRGACRAGRC